MHNALLEKGCKKPRGIKKTNAHSSQEVAFHTRTRTSLSSKLSLSLSLAFSFSFLFECIYHLQRAVVDYDEKETMLLTALNTPSLVNRGKEKAKKTKGKKEKKT